MDARIKSAHDNEWDGGAKADFASARTTDMTSPIVYGARYSTYTRSVLLTLEEKSVPYRLEEIDIFRGGVPAGYLERQPFGRIPAFEHDGFRLYETAAIMRYVDEAFAGPSLQPPDARGRARMMQVIGILDSYAYRAMVWDIFVERRDRPDGRPPDEERIGRGVSMSRTCLRAIAGLMGDAPYLAGPALTLADLHAAPIVGYLRLTAEGSQLITAEPALETWWAAMSQRRSMAATRSPLEPALLERA